MNTFDETKRWYSMLDNGMLPAGTDVRRGPYGFTVAFPPGRQGRWTVSMTHTKRGEFLGSWIDVYDDREAHAHHFEQGAWTVLKDACTRGRVPFAKRVAA